MLTIYSIWYNRSSSLKESVTSLLNAAPKYAKVVLVDDLSTDPETYKLMQEISESDKRVYVEKNHKNKGFVRTLRDSIIKFEYIFKNKFIAIHGAGDLCATDRFDKQISFLDNNKDFAFVACKYNLINQSLKIVQSSSFSGEIDKKSLKSSPKWTHGSIVIRADIYFSVSGYNVNFEYCQDWFLYINLLQNTRGYVLEESLYSKFIYEDGASYKPSKRFQQLIYSSAAIKASAFDENQLKEFIEALERKSIEAFIDINSPEFITRLRKSIYLVVISGEMDFVRDWGLVLKSNYRFYQIPDLYALSFFLGWISKNYILKRFSSKVFVSLGKLAFWIKNKVSTHA